MLAVSGWRGGLPPTFERCCDVPGLKMVAEVGSSWPAGTPPHGLFDEQFAFAAAPMSTFVPFALGGETSHGSSTFGNESDWPENSSAMCGARNAVPYVPRNATPPAVFHRPPSLYVPPVR